jgi:hypothetical protein
MADQPTVTDREEKPQAAKPVETPSAAPAQADWDDTQLEDQRKRERAAKPESVDVASPPPRDELERLRHDYLQNPAVAAADPPLSLRKCGPAVW